MAIQVAARPVVPSAADEVDQQLPARIAPGAGATVVEEVVGHVLRVSGRLDVHSVPDVRSALHRAVDAGVGELVVLVDDIVVGDATGLGVFLGAHRRAQRSGRRLVLRGVPLPALRLLRVTRLHRVMEVEGAPVLSAGMPADDHAVQNNRESTSSMPRRAS
ncbi:MAG: STAS domain-containing protein [Janthinobacterium lividum]